MTALRNYLRRLPPADRAVMLADLRLFLARRGAILMARSLRMDTWD